MLILSLIDFHFQPEYFLLHPQVTILRNWTSLPNRAPSFWPEVIWCVQTAFIGNCAFGPGGDWPSHIYQNHKRNWFFSLSRLTEFWNRTWICTSVVESALFNGSGDCPTTAYEDRNPASKFYVVVILKALQCFAILFHRSLDVSRLASGPAVTCAQHCGCTEDIVYTELMESFGQATKNLLFLNNEVRRKIGSCSRES